MKIALIPIYNEESTLGAVLESAGRWADYLVLVDDGSTDRSARIAQEWLATTGKQGNLIALPENQGMGAALKAGFVHIARGLEAVRWRPTDLVVFVDADGQYPDDAPLKLCAHLEAGGWDVASVRRDFSLYPAYKRLGNSLLSRWASLLCGRRFFDIEAGLRVMRARVVPSLLEYFAGERYSCSQEIGILSVLLGFKVDNSLVQPVSYYRSRTRVLDFLRNAAEGLMASQRARSRRKLPAA
ncbi:MAG: glycosyltransferase family 2 protein [Elusimicrobia bacterium]|nr:glycosyltransferase family 2 protein [Elusimicrobiota bacterium]